MERRAPKNNPAEPFPRWNVHGNRASFEAAGKHAGDRVRTGRHVDVQQLPALSAMLLAMTVPTELVIVIVPPLDLPTRLSQFGTER